MNNRNPTQQPLQARHQSSSGTLDLNMTVDMTKMFGLLHNPDGTRRQRLVRSLKVGFGQPSGPDIHVFIDPRRVATGQDKWVIQVGRIDDEKKKRVLDRTYAPDKAAAKEIYERLKDKVQKRKYPTKFTYFTFSRMGVSGNYEPDFDEIDKHGPAPRRVGIVCLTNDAFQHAFEAWSATQLLCKGNGRDARRSIDWPQSDEELKIAEIAKQQSLRDFPIVGGCYACGCPFARPNPSDPDKAPPCKPHGRLIFQLANSPQIGEHCTFDTTGWGSTGDLFASINDIMAVTGGLIAGIPLVLKLRSYKTVHNKKPTTQLGVTLEFLAKDALELAHTLNRYAGDFRAAIAAAPRRIQGPPNLIEGPQATEEVVDEEMSEAEQAAQMSREFYPIGDEDYPDEADEVLEENADPAVDPVVVSADMPGPFGLAVFSDEEISWMLKHGNKLEPPLTRARLIDMMGTTTLTKAKFIAQFSDRK